MTALLAVPGRGRQGCRSNSSAVMGKDGAAVLLELCPWAGASPTSREVPGVVLPPDPADLRGL